MVSYIIWKACILKKEKNHRKNTRQGYLGYLHKKSCPLLFEWAHNIAIYRGFELYSELVGESALRNEL